jgi:acid phosphatase type 7
MRLVPLPPAPRTVVTAMALATTLLAAQACTVSSASADTTAVLVGAGDISLCSSTGDDATGKLVKSVLTAAGSGTAEAFTAGDNVQLMGASSEYSTCYTQAWGSFKSRTRPVPGNHDYFTSDGSPYFSFFGSAAGTGTTGYYSYDLGDWHVIALNSSCAEVGGCQAGSPQEQWLRNDLATTTKQCTIAYWHHPLFTSSSTHPPTEEVRPLFQALYDGGAEIVVNGHNHIYERFAPQDPTGAADAAKGIRQFIVGTGGASHYTIGTVAPNSEVRNGATFGVLKLTLVSGGYSWNFMPVSGQTFTDSGTGTCH